MANIRLNATYTGASTELRIVHCWECLTGGQGFRPYSRLKLYTQGTSCSSGISCADCRMALIEVQMSEEAFLADTQLPADAKLTLNAPSMEPLKVRGA